MAKGVLIGLLFSIITLPEFIFGQVGPVDSNLCADENAAGDSGSLKQMLIYSNKIAFANPTASLARDQKTLSIAREMNYRRIEAEALNSCGEDYHFMGKYTEALEMQMEALELDRQNKDDIGQADTRSLIGILYNELGEYRTALQYLIPSDSIYLGSNPPRHDVFTLALIGDSYDSLQMLDSAAYYVRNAYQYLGDNDDLHERAFVINHMGNIYAQLHKTDSALDLFRVAIEGSARLHDKLNSIFSYKNIADVYLSLGNNDSSLRYAREAFYTARSISAKGLEMRAAQLMRAIFEKMGKLDSAYAYAKTTAALKDSLYGPEKFQQLQVLLLRDQQQQFSNLAREEAFKNRLRSIFLIAAAAIFLVIGFILFRANRQKQKANTLLNRQKNEIEETLSKLRSAQAQLIQSEKMASLGELTAGIAHEIQNPLNFVNNFSEVNTELIAELLAERKKGLGDFSSEDNLLNDIKGNEEKINQHGKRADAIVKSMMLHSRLDAGQKELADINKLANEYLRLSYLGFRGKDNSFSATTKTDFDETIGMVSIIPQDIGRVLLNLYNNAFYAVNEKSKQQIKGYEPSVLVTTKKAGGKVELRVKDNGSGIPQNLTDKIFQPFFTTKPAGQGTGLGLSLSYDIIKAHGGTIRVDSKEGEEAEFEVQLPA